MSSERTYREEIKEIGDDVLAIPPRLMWWEYLIIILVVGVFEALLVWYVVEYMLVASPEPGFLGLPKPISGAIIISITWIVLNFIIGGTYYMVITRRIKSLRSSGSRVVEV
ncbi:MAG: hypothetical protein QXU60_05605 [Sulfolobales archaeon]